MKNLAQRFVRFLARLRERIEVRESVATGGQVARLNALLLFLTIACALGVVTSQHKARKLFVELQNEKDRAQQMDVEWGKLQLEQSTLVTPARVEKLARQQLQMHMPQSEQVRYVRMNGIMVGQP